MLSVSERPKSLIDMVFGFSRATRSYYLKKDYGPCGGSEEQEKWRLQIEARKTQLNQAMVSFATMIASMSWYEGNRSIVEAVADVFKLMRTGYMPAPVVLTCIKWLGADINSHESCDEAIDQLVAILNEHSSEWERIEQPGNCIPAIGRPYMLLPLQKEMEKVLPIPYRCPDPDD